jgi:formylglycine-generating enzyme required for sulfatase activity
MKARILNLCFYLSLVFLGCPDARAFLVHGPIELSVGIVINTIDGEVIHECIGQQIVGRSGHASLLLGIAADQSTPSKDWEEIYPAVFCANDNGGQVGIATVDQSLALNRLSTIKTFWRVDRQMEDERVLTLEVSILSRQIDASNEDDSGMRQPELKRKLFFSEDSVTYIPVPLGTDEKLQALGLEDVFISLGATALKDQQDAIYGTLLVMSGADAAEVLLDGGVAGQISAQSEKEIGLVQAGVREVGLRNASGKVVRKVVRVVADRTVLVNFDEQQEPEETESYALEPRGVNSHGYEEFIRKNDAGVVVRVPQGEFLMGNRDTERTPLEHQVYVSEFLMDKTGVSWGQYKKFAAATGIPLPPHRPYWGILDDHPAVYVTWEEAKTYCEWAGGRLPTEAEREKAARGTDGRKFPWGNEEPKDRLGVFRQSWGYDSTGSVYGHAAGASPYGLLNMGGNVWEWCADWYDGDYYETSPYRDPKGPATGRAHVVRGGSWDSRPTVLSASCRSWGHRGYRDGDFGFRCAMNNPQESEQAN